METGKHFNKNQKRLEGVTDNEWAAALEKCRRHIEIRLKRRTVFGAHTATRLGENPLVYYLSYAYDAILSGRWEWKEDHTLSEQLIYIADSTISTEVEKMSSKESGNAKIVYDDFIVKLYEEENPQDELTILQQAMVYKQVAVLEEAIKDDPDLQHFWECVREGFKRSEIAAFMEKTLKQVDRLRDKLIEKLKKSAYFEM
jgi:hypothetical protein